MANVPSPVTMASGSHASLTGKVRTAALGASDVKWLCLSNRPLLPSADRVSSVEGRCTWVHGCKGFGSFLGSADSGLGVRRVS